MTEETKQKIESQEKKKIVAKPLPVNKEKAEEIETDMKTSKKEEPKIQGLKKSPDVTARGRALPVSKKHSVYLCRFIKDKEIDKAINDLNTVLMLKKSVPFKGEIPHKKGTMSARYPLKACKYFISVLKGLKGSALMKGLELERTKIKTASASDASRPMRTRGRSAKRTNLLITAGEVKSAEK